MTYYSWSDSFAPEAVALVDSLAGRIMRRLDVFPPCQAEKVGH